MADIKSGIMGGKIGTIESEGSVVTINLGGSNDMEDYLMASRCLPKDGIHSGIQAVYEECLRIHVELITASQEVILKGYSAGGMLAQKILYELRNKRCPHILIRTKGSPRVLSRKKVKSIKTCMKKNGTQLTMERIVYGNDPIPVLFPGYTHICKSTPAGPRRIPGGWLLPWNWKDHVGYFK